MNREFDAYLNLHAIGVWYKSTLPPTLIAAIDAYNSGLYLRLAGDRFNVRHAAAPVPAVAAPATPNGLFVGGVGYAAPVVPAPVGPMVALGAELTNLSAAMGGTLLASASPFIYVHPHNAGVNVNYGSGVTVTQFLGAWRELVRACAGAPVNFAWPLGANWNTQHKKVEFAAAALAETYRDPVQLGAIYLLGREPFGTTFGGQNIWQVLPMCQGGSYNPMRMGIGGRTETMMASTQVFHRCYRVSQNDVTLLAGLDALGVARVSQGRRMMGTVSAVQWDLSSKHLRKRVRTWYWG